MDKIGLFAGTFDPPTMGHIDAIRRAELLTHHLIVAVTNNTSKKPLFTAHERIEMLKKVLPNVEIVTFDGLITDFAKLKNATFLIRGLRTFNDFEHEFQMAAANKQLSGIETIFLMANEKLIHLSSTLIREIAHFGGSLHNFVPPEIESFIQKKMEKL